MKPDEVNSFLGIFGIFFAISGFFLEPIILILAFFSWFVMGLIRITRED